MLYNVYCDETCHLEHDGINDMVIGAVWCPQEKLREINQRIREIKIRNGISPTAELKWTKISPANTVDYNSAYCAVGSAIGFFAIGLSCL